MAEAETEEVGQGAEKVAAAREAVAMEKVRATAEKGGAAQEARMVVSEVGRAAKQGAAVSSPHEMAPPSQNSSRGPTVLPQMSGRPEAP